MSAAEETLFMLVYGSEAVLLAEIAIYTQ